MAIFFGVALNSWKQFVRDRIFYVALIVALLMVGFSYLLATLTIVESRKILLDFGFSAVSLAGVTTAVYLGIVAMAREIEQRTIYTVITKPISRSTYLLGKFLGSSVVLAVAHVLVGLTLAGIVWEVGEGLPNGYFVCLFLIFLENLILLAVAFFCSVFTNSILAAVLSLMFFLIGRSNSSFQLMAERAHTEGVKALARALYFAMPNLDRFNIRDVVAYGRPFPLTMVWIGALYAGAYIAICLALSCLAIQARDMP